MMSWLLLPPVLRPCLVIQPLLCIQMMRSIRSTMASVWSIHSVTVPYLLYVMTLWIRNLEQVSWGKYISKNGRKIWSDCICLEEFISLLFFFHQSCVAILNLHVHNLALLVSEVIFFSFLAQVIKKQES